MDDKKQQKEKEQKALKKRAVSDDPYLDFEEVNSLVAVSYAKYEETGNLKKCLKELSSAISTLAKKQ